MKALQTTGIVTPAHQLVVDVPSDVASETTKIGLWPQPARDQGCRCPVATRRKEV
jgi:hypothetical protein